MSLKLQIAKLIGRQYVIGNEYTYEDVLEAIYENQYRCVLKVPSQEFFLGIVESFRTGDDLILKNKILNAAKEVVREALELSGFELTFSDHKWNELQIIHNTERWGSKYILSEKPKTYLCEYFEI